MTSVSIVISGQSGGPGSGLVLGRGPRSWPRPNTPGRSDLGLICALRAVLLACVPALTASARSCGKATPIGTKVLTSITRCCGLDAMRPQHHVSQCGSCGVSGRRVGTGAADRPAPRRQRATADGTRKDWPHPRSTGPRTGTRRTIGETRAREEPCPHRPRS